MPGCPLNKMMPCVGKDCAWWIEMMVKETKTGEIQDASACAIVKTPILLLEQLRMTNGVQAAVESSRNENLKRQDALLGLLVEARENTRALTNGQ